jgi:NAD(P)-dependent dehydrogenase (short-subunit alcohol dehydrogenase family)
MQTRDALTPAAGRLAGRCALVTGAGGPMGQAIALRFAAEGAALVLTDISGNRLQETAAAVGHLYPTVQVVAVRANVLDREEVESMLAAMASAAPVDILINVVGGLRGALYAPLLDMEEGRWQQTMDLNLGATLLLVKRLAPGMLERGYGRIVNFSSIAYAGERGQSDYAAAKAAVAALTRSLAMELAPSINVNCVAPGLIDTSVVSRLDAQLIEGFKNGCALKRLGRPDEIAQAVLFLASEEASYITGEILHVAGGRWPAL